MCRPAQSVKRSGGRRASARWARSPRIPGRAGSGSAESGDRSWSARRAGRSSHGGTGSRGNADTRRTGRAADQSREPQVGGEGGIRTHEVFRLSAFQERRHQPLGHLSVEEDTGRSESVAVAARLPAASGPWCRVGNDAGGSRGVGRPPRGLVVAWETTPAGRGESVGRLGASLSRGERRQRIQDRWSASSGPRCCVGGDDEGSGRVVSRPAR